jgi:hypothetical protein
VLLTTPAFAQGQWWDKAPPPAVDGQVMPSSWWEAAKRGAARWNTDPFRIAEVAWIEAGGWKTGCAVGPGRNGRKYVPPMGFNRNCNIPREVMYTPELQIEYAAILLSGDLTARLHRYNATWYKDNYVRDVLALKQRLEREARFLVRFSGKPAGKEPS